MITWPPRVSTSVGNDRVPLDPALQPKPANVHPTIDTAAPAPRIPQDLWGDPSSGKEITGTLFGVDGPFQYTGMGPHVTTTNADGSTDQSQHETVAISPGTATTDAAASIIRREEGFAGTAGWDVNAYRGGYGSDTYTTADGVVHQVGKDQVISKDDAERDVQRRIPILNARVAKQIGPAYNKLPGYVQGNLIAMEDNYGTLPASVAAAARTGDLNALADAVEARGADNGGIRRARYKRSADMIRGIGLQTYNGSPV